VTDYDRLYRRLAQEIIKHDGKIGDDATAFIAELTKRLRAERWQFGPDSEAVLADYLTSAQAAIRTGIEAASSVAIGKSMQSSVVMRLSEQAFKERWPDGLKLSDRLWNWDKATRDGVQKVLQDGVRQGKAVSSLIYDMQRSIERSNGGRRFKIVENHIDDWVTELYQSAQELIHDPSARSQWNAIVGEVRERIDGLKATGSRHAAEQVFKQIETAVNMGREVLLDEAVKWWTYDKQLYALKRIARTEMATAAHRAVIASTENDDSIIGYQWRLSGSHPATDICDYYANIDMGLGKGVWTKEAVPHHKAHPHCMCLLIPRVTAIKQKGATNYAEFIRNSPQHRREQLLPKWAQESINNGVSLDDLIRPDGLGLITKAASLEI